MRLGTLIDGAEAEALDVKPQTDAASQSKPPAGSEAQGDRRGVCMIKALAKPGRVRYGKAFLVSTFIGPSRTEP